MLSQTNNRNELNNRKTRQTMTIIRRHVFKSRNQEHLRLALPMPHCILQRGMHGVDRGKPIPHFRADFDLFFLSFRSKISK